MSSLSLNRRQFLSFTSLVLGSGWVGLHSVLPVLAAEEGWSPEKPFSRGGGKLRVQPILMYRLPTPREATSWKSWGGVQTAAAVEQETARIEGELAQLAKEADFQLSFLPLAAVTGPEEVAKIPTKEFDVVLVYACTGSGELLKRCLGLKPDALIFVRQRSGPAYYWYEALSTKILAADSAAASDEAGQKPAHVDDVVVDDGGELLWRLRALQAVKSLRATRIVALGGPWGKYAPDAPQKAQERFGLKIVDVSYDDFGPRIRRAVVDEKMIKRAEARVNRYLALPQTGLKTERKFVVNAFVLYDLFMDLMREQDCSAFTIKSCMGTILPLSETTACLTLALMNDEGPIAFCESDFVIIPAGLLLRHIAGKPVFLHNSTFPHKGIVTCAHCTCPRRLDGRKYEPVQLVTHYESDFGAAPKVEMPIGQEVTILDPEYSSPRWVGFKGTVKANPFYDICRSQQDVEVQGNWKKLKSEVRDSHWVMVYGDYLNELGYAARKLGMKWEDLSEA
jgi:L-fucose isomerase-like protein